jgi:hypothetical protein
MDFDAVLDQTLALLRQRGRVSYRALKRQFDLDDAYLDNLKVELIEVQQCARDQEGTMLAWTGPDAAAAASVPLQPQAPLAYTPPHLAGHCQRHAKSLTDAFLVRKADWGEVAKREAIVKEENWG